MYIYLSIPILLYLAQAFNNSSTRKIIFVLLAIFYCFAYKMGSDYEIYQMYFNDTFSSRLVEPIFMYVSNLCKSLGLNFWMFYSTFKLLSYIPLFYMIHLLSNKCIYIPLMLFYSSFGLILFIDCPFRSLIATSLVNLGLLFIYKYEISDMSQFCSIKFVPYLGIYFIICFLATGFHVSSLVAVIFPLFRATNYRNRNLLLIWLAVFSFLSIFGVSVLFQFLPSFLIDTMDFYSEGISSDVFSLGLILRVFCLWGLLYFRNKFTMTKKGVFLFNFTYIYLLLHLISIVFPMLYRLAFLLSPFYVVSMAKISQYMKPKYGNIVTFLLFLVSMIVTFTFVSGKYEYLVPYNNLLIFF